MKLKTREEWLHAYTDALKPLFAEQEKPVPKNVRLSIGWPSVRALSAKSRRIGECWDPSASADKAHEIFISPALHQEHVGPTLVHELIHAAVGCKEGHKGLFRSLAINLGLEGKMTATKAGAELRKRLNTIEEEIGEYPHAPLDRNMRGKKQTTRMLKLVCCECGYTVRTSQKWLDVGMPTCCCGEDMGLDGGEDE